MKVLVEKEISKEELESDLSLLDNALIDGRLNLCYGDAYYAASLKQKYGLPVEELRKILEKAGSPRRS